MPWERPKKWQKDKNKKTKKQKNKKLFNVSLDISKVSCLFLHSICRNMLFYNVLLLIIILVFFLSFRATPTAYGGSQARGPIGTVAAGLHQSHSNAGSKLHLRPTPQLTTMPDP